MIERDLGWLGDALILAYYLGDIVQGRDTLEKVFSEPSHLI